MSSGDGKSWDDFGKQDILLVKEKRRCLLLIQVEKLAPPKIRAGVGLKLNEMQEELLISLGMRTYGGGVHQNADNVKLHHNACTWQSGWGKEKEGKVTLLSHILEKLGHRHCLKQADKHPGLNMFTIWLHLQTP